MSELSVVPTDGPSERPFPWEVTDDEVARHLQAHPDRGLTPDEAARRLQETGPNELRQASGPKPLVVLARQFQGVLVWVLFAAAGVSAAIGEVTDSVAIVAILVLNAITGFFQEYRAETAVAALRKLTVPVCRVVRGGEAQIVSANAVVPGDLILLKAGDVLPADARLLRATSLQVNEAALTGESVPVQKAADVVLSPDTPLADRTNMVYLGGHVTAGQGGALVTATGMRTEVGRIAGLLQTAGTDTTPLQERLDRVGKLLVTYSLGIVLLVFVLGLLRGEPWMAMLLTAVSLAVAAVPEGLPAVVTVALALGMTRMAQRHVLVRRLPAVETLGCAQVICSDKTGTLTTGQMTLASLWMSGAEQDVPHGKTPVAATPPGVRRLLEAAAGCTEATLSREGPEGAKVVGDPMEGALLRVARTLGIERPDLESAQPRVREIPFDSDRKRMAIVRRGPDGPRLLLKGAPDVLLARATAWVGPEGHVLPLADDTRAALAAANEALAGRALRVLGVAERELLPGQVEAESEELEAGITLIGLLAFRDPPRDEVRGAIADCQRASVRVVMITGDHPATAAAIAEELGIRVDGDRVATGRELQELSAAELGQFAQKVTVYARVTAEDKLRVVRALRACGQVVAMTGDGVNDAPALREADIGVAMGRTGTEVTKAAADIIVTDDNFASIVAAVEEGRGIYDNIRKCLQYLLAGNTAEILVMLVAVIAGWPMPLIPLQILWINLVTDGPPALALAADLVDADVLSHPPRSRDAPILNRDFCIRVGLTGILSATVTLAAFLWGLWVIGSVEVARSLAFTTLVFDEVLRSFSVRSLDRPFWRNPAPPNYWLLAVAPISIGLQFSLHQVPAFQKLFGTHSLGLADALVLLALGSVPLWVLELLKERKSRRPTVDRPGTAALTNRLE